MRNSRPSAEGHEAVIDRLRTHLLPDDKPASSDDPLADVLARVYALLLSWPEPNEEEPGAAEEPGQ